MKILIFDFDGTIVDSLDVVFELCSELFLKHGIKFRDKADFVQLYDENFYEAIVKRGFPEGKIPALLKELQIELPKRMANVPLFDRMDNVLEKLKNKSMIFIVTSSISGPIEDYLKKAGINVEEVIGAEKEVSKTKKILKIKERFPDADVFYIGDTSGDVREGKRAGVKTVAVTWGYHNKNHLKKEKPDYLIDSPEELLEKL